MGLLRATALNRGSGCPRKTSFLLFTRRLRRRLRKGNNWGHPRPRQGEPCTPKLTPLGSRKLFSSDYIVVLSSPTDQAGGGVRVRKPGKDSAQCRMQRAKGVTKR